MNIEPKVETRASRRRRGVILILVTWIMVILVTMSLVMGQRIRVANRATQNRLAQMVATETERGAEQWVLCQTDAMSGDAKSK